MFLSLAFSTDRKEQKRSGHKPGSLLCAAGNNPPPGFTGEACHRHCSQFSSAFCHVASVDGGDNSTDADNNIVEPPAHRSLSLVQDRAARNTVDHSRVGHSKADHKAANILDKEARHTHAGARLHKSLALQEPRPKLGLPRKGGRSPEATGSTNASWHTSSNASNKYTIMPFCPLPNTRPAACLSRLGQRPENSGSFLPGDCAQYCRRQPGPPPKQCGACASPSTGTGSATTAGHRAAGAPPWIRMNGPVPRMASKPWRKWNKMDQPGARTRARARIRAMEVLPQIVEGN